MKYIDNHQLLNIYGASKSRDRRDDTVGDNGIKRGYGAQGNGFIGNTAVQGQGLLDNNCATGIIGGMIASGGRGGVAGVALGMAGGALAGGCFK